MRDLDALPKAHLHLHFTGAMRLPTLVELADARMYLAKNSGRDRVVTTSDGIPG